MVRFPIASSRTFHLKYDGNHLWNTNRYTTSATYTVTATNTGGTDTVTLTIVVNDIAPSSLTYSRIRSPDQGRRHDDGDAQR